MVRGNVLDVQVSIILDVVKLCHTFHRGDFMLRYLQRDGTHSLAQRVSRILTVGHRHEGLTPTSVHKLRVDATKHVYRA